MINEKYTGLIIPFTTNYGDYMGICIKSQTTTTLSVHKYVANWAINWQVSGYAM